MPTFEMETGLIITGSQSHGVTWMHALVQKFAEPLFGAFCKRSVLCTEPAPSGSPSRAANLLLTGGCISNG